MAEKAAVVLVVFQVLGGKTANRHGFKCQSLTFFLTFLLKGPLAIGAPQPPKADIASHTLLMQRSLIMHWKSGCSSISEPHGCSTVNVPASAATIRHNNTTLETILLAAITSVLLVLVAPQLELPRGRDPQSSGKCGCLNF